ncbi:hypothetical protein [Xanthomonas phage Xp15]|uniref:Uncharacterized protein n=1 Tax=Xanthomonas phage Xp15 TaxID=322855 RepID=Q52PT5_9CAUD|nr:hypothetical protein XPXV15_gp76 [Xanthomonas phage Xp15]AAX84912.1 hypothetical protein [Xanthomonas phage Xp15]
MVVHYLILEIRMTAPRVDGVTELRFEVEVSEGLVQGLRALARVHYDGVCQRAADQISERAVVILRNHEEWMLDLRPAERKKHWPKIVLKSSEVDTLLKLLECQSYIRPDHVAYTYLSDLRLSLSAAWHYMKGHYKVYPWASHSGVTPDMAP